MKPSFTPGIVALPATWALRIVAGQL